MLSTAAWMLWLIGLLWVYCSNLEEIKMSVKIKDILLLHWIATLLLLCDGSLIFFINILQDRLYSICLIL